MKRKSLCLLLGAVAAFALMTGNSAEACDGGCGGVYGLGVYGNYSGAPYATGRIPTPPYFALHPPVHYQGQPVPRSYGHSPFAFPGRTTAETMEHVQAEVIENPYVRRAAEPKAKPIEADENRVAEIVPQIIRNPFVAPTAVSVQMANAQK